MKDIADRISLGIPDIIREHHPNIIILGGPMGKIFRLFEPYLPRDLGVELRRPKRPNESAIYGCYLYAKNQKTNQHRAGFDDGTQRVRCGSVHGERGDLRRYQLYRR